VRSGTPAPLTTTRTCIAVSPFRRFNEFSDDELQQIPILPEAARLEQGAA
jgi:hypothetical protein